MKRIVLVLVLALSLPALGIDYRNPILPYDYSDPDVCRVGKTYLMTSSSFHNIPGLQILQSEDLIHWQIVDAALRQALPDHQPGSDVRGKGVWAPSIRTHAGYLYIYYGDPDRGIYCVRADIRKGLHFPLSWEPARLVMPAKGYIDPCPLWDKDGRCYLVHALAGSRAGLKSCLLMAELTSDGLQVKVPSRIIYDGHEQHPTCEGPKLYQRHGYYYIMHPAGGVATGWQVVQRSRHIYGPYEQRITLAQGSTSINGPHQGAYIETPKGEGWFYHFQDVGAAGRIVHLQPVRWVDDWPVMGEQGEPVYQYGAPKDTCWAHLARRDEFDQPTLGLDWQAAGGRIDPKWWFSDATHSMLRLYSYPQEEGRIPNLLLQKIPAVAFCATARVRFCPNTHKRLQGKEEAGMVVSGRTTYQLPIEQTNEWVYLRLDMDAQQKGQFYTSKDGQQWQTSGEEFVASEGYWTGAQVGLYCTRQDSAINDSGWLDVDWFEISIDRDTLVRSDRE